jgi:hypothetical protein
MLKVLSGIVLQFDYKISFFRDFTAWLSTRKMDNKADQLRGEGLLQSVRPPKSVTPPSTWKIHDRKADDCFAIRALNIILQWWCVVITTIRPQS